MGARSIFNHHAPWSLTQRAAYWAGGLNPFERGDPLTITGTVDQLVENVQKAACLQMMYDRELKQESPIVIPVDPERMTPLILGLPDSLKAIGIQLQGKIQATSQSERAVAALEGLLSPDRKTEKKVWTWGEVAQELINYGRKYSPVNISSKIDTKGLRRTEVKTPPCPTNGKCQTPPISPGGRNIPNKRQRLWTSGWQKGIPKNLMDGLHTEKLEKLVLE